MVAEEIHGWMHPEELAWLRGLALRSSVLVEIGCWQGRSTHALAECCPGVVFAVDHFLGSPGDCDWDLATALQSGAWEEARKAFLANLAPFIAEGKAFLIELPSDRAAEHLAVVLKHRKADAIFIDGDHSYEAVRGDISRWLPLLRSGGTLCGHDLDRPGVSQAVEELLPGWQTGHMSIWQWRKP